MLMSVSESDNNWRVMLMVRPIDDSFTRFRTLKPLFCVTRTGSRWDVEIIDSSNCAFKSSAILRRFC